MKRILKGLIFAFVGVLAFTLASCGEEKSEHQPQPGWYRDASSHWHNCGHCDEQLDLAVHNYDIWVLTQGKCEETRKCKTCGFIQTRNVEHTWSDWADNGQGGMSKECTRCGHAESVTQYYVKGTINEWSTNEDHKLVIDYENMTAEVTITLAVGDQFKVTLADSWDIQFNYETTEFEEGLFDTNSDGNLVAKTAADYKVVVSGLGGTDHKCTVTQLCVHEYVWTVAEGKTCDFNGVCSKCQATSTKVEHTWGDDIKCDKCNALSIVEYYVKGSFLETQWGAADANKFTVASDNKSSSYVLVLEAGDQFKVGTKDGWEFDASNTTFNVEGFNAGEGNIVCNVPGIYVATVSGIDTEKQSLAINAVQLYVRGDAVGTWDAKAENALKYYRATDTAMIEIEVADATKGFKIAPADWGLANNALNIGVKEGQYVCAGDSGNITVEAAGKYMITVVGVAHGTPKVTIKAVTEDYKYAVTPLYLRGGVNGWGVDADYYLTPVQKRSGQTTYIEYILNVYLPKDCEFKLADEHWGVEFAYNEELDETLFANANGNIKTLKEGYYSFVVSGVKDKATAKLAANLYEEKSLADAKAAEAGTLVYVEGTVKSVNGDNVVITDGTNDLNVYKLHTHVGDTVAIIGVMGVYKENPQVNSPVLVGGEVGAEHVLNGTLTKVTSVDQLTDGAKVVVSYGQFVMGAQNKGDYRNQILSEDHLDACQTVVTLVKAGDNWKLQVEDGKFLFYSSAEGFGKNKVYVGEATDETAQWTISIVNGKVVIENVAVAGRLLQYNVNDPRFACYTGSQQNLDLYILTAAAE